MPRKDKLKTLGFILLVIILSIVFIDPVRNYMNSLFHRDKTELKEYEIIGAVSGYSSHIKELQQILKDAGFKPGPIDGRMGGQTRKAIKEFQKARNLKPTGRIDSATQLALNREKEMIKQSPKIESEDELYLEQPIHTDLKTEALKVTIKSAEKKAEVQDEIMNYRLKSKNRTKQIQTALTKANFYKGEIDGKIGPQTKKAIMAFQKSKNLTPDGVVGSKTWEELKKYLTAERR